MFKKISIDSNVRAVLEETIPKQLIQTRRVANVDLAYVSGNFVIDALNRAFNYCWSWSIDHYWIQPSQDKKYKDRNTGQETVTSQPPVAHVIGTLTVFLQNKNGETVKISKSGAGSKSVIGGSSEQESIFKSASTDAIKKAASLLGIGAQLYRDNREQEYFEQTLVSAPWDSETEEMLKSDINWLELCKKENNFSDDYVNSIVSGWSNGKFRTVSSLPPYKFTEFVRYLKEAQRAATESKE